MRKLSTILFASLLALPAFGQRPTKMLTPQQALQRASYGPLFQQQLQGLNPESPARNQQVTPANYTATPSAYGKVKKINAVTLGRSSNAFTHIRPQQNEVFYVDSLDLALYIHRQDVTIFGGGTNANGKFRYDLSVDGGATFTNDIGDLQTIYTNYGRYPQGVVANPDNSSNPFDTKLVYFAPTNKFPTPGWIDYVNGVSDVVMASPSSSDFYMMASRNTLLPGGLTEGAPGVFWTTDNTFDGTNILDSLRIMKGVWNSGTGEVDWTLHASLVPGYSTSYDGVPHAVGPNIAFSPDGQHGWMGFVGDITGGADSVYQPIFYHSTDGGNTWGNPVEVQLRNISWIIDSLEVLWVDSLGNPAASGLITTAFDCDMTVDINGNVHMGVVIGSASTTASPEPGYSIASSIAMFMADVHTDDGGATWDVDYIAPVLTLRGEFGTPDANGALLTMDNVCQVGRDLSGEHIFYSWVDSDTNVVGFGETNNLAPNLRIAGKRISDDAMTCWNRVTDGDITWDGRALYPMMSPIVRTNAATAGYNLPIVMLEMITNDQSAPCQFQYFGAEADLCEADFMPQASVATNWDGSCYTALSCVVGIQEPTPLADMLIGAYPNPTNGMTTIYFDLARPSQVEMNLMNAMGQRITSLAQGSYNNGRHEISLDASQLPSGIYFYTLRTASGLKSGKLVIE